ncbi:MAG: DUF559 domain-containing protein, partial [Phycisphaerae bacterium]|nr:DUF559 domain-containing protein [Phycisphaerae bacterium]
PERALIIEVDGDFHFTEEASLYDRERTAYLQGAGLRVIRFTNKQIFDSLGSVVKEIWGYMGQPINDFSIPAVWNKLELWRQTV